MLTMESKQGKEVMKRLEDEKNLGRPGDCELSL
jgi:hypothetical protein